MVKAAENIYKLTLKDLIHYKNKTVKVSQIDNILDTYMLLLNSKLLPNGDVEGELVYFGDGNSDEYNKWFLTENAITPLYFDKAEYADGVVYDE